MVSNGREFRQGRMPRRSSRRHTSRSASSLDFQAGINSGSFPSCGLASAVFLTAFILLAMAQRGKQA
ncbi:hypothetical protein HMPREF1155_0508 [Slackia sp. CM382]|nr:hypothetical protein HMPREF1155_0508 [Slackia sp. CM382]